MTGGRCFECEIHIYYRPKEGLENQSPPPPPPPPPSEEESLASTGVASAMRILGNLPISGRSGGASVAYEECGRRDDAESSAGKREDSRACSFGLGSGCGCCEGEGRVAPPPPAVSLLLMRSLRRSRIGEV